MMFDVVVVGAGVEGSATAYDLIRRNRRVLLLEQFPLPHNRGSSHGQTRVTRKAYPQPFYTEMMNFCTEQWTQLQEKAGDVLYRQIGYLALGEKNGRFLQDNIFAMTQHGAPFAILSPGELREKFAMLRYPERIGGVLDREGGILMSDKCLRALQRLFVENGGVIRDGEQYQSLTPGEVIHVRTNRGEYQCRSIVFACGPWANKVLSTVGLSLPLKPMRITVCYWPELNPGSHSADKLPPFFEENCCDGHSIYGLPSEEYPGHVKLCLHHGPDIDPDKRDACDYLWTVDLLKDYVSKHFPGLVPTPSVVESCIYTNTPDKNFIIDRHPKWKNIVFGAGFSGHGFKLAPAVGQVLADMALDEPVRYDTSHFRLSRFGTGVGQAKL
ncbi:peroxisomal sarcosine oxidase [Aplysia californica]|uniref:Peroxisomal sarcosine oxidase n=1 Tax=Aplysia californica TaxID=6500 RepID=A0ABM1W365_APLCA|nr:peroxisomal sarcosine oxidase [Aplysia californica]